jgi:hypothetical protein
MERLTGGYINRVYKDDGIVRKEFTGDDLVGKSATSRLAREKSALSKFGGGIAPAFLGISGENALLQEYLPGRVLEEVIRDDGEGNCFAMAGRLLREIHEPVREKQAHFRDIFEQRLERNHARAEGLLKREGINVSIEFDWQKVFKLGITRVHRDFWMGNVMQGLDGNLRVFDWEFSGIGSPYEDFAIVDLWVIREFGGEFVNCTHDFWAGYGYVPDQGAIDGFLVARLVEFLATTTISQYDLEDRDGFYHNKIEVLKELLAK